MNGAEQKTWGLLLHHGIDQESSRCLPIGARDAHQLKALGRLIIEGVGDACHEGSDGGNSNPDQRKAPWFFPLGCNGYGPLLQNLVKMHMAVCDKTFNRKEQAVLDDPT